MVMIVSEIKVPIAKPIIGDEEIENVVEVLLAMKKLKM